MSCLWKEMTISLVLSPRDCLIYGRFSPRDCLIYGRLYRAWAPLLGRRCEGGIMQYDKRDGAPHIKSAIACRSEEVFPRPEGLVCLQQPWVAVAQRMELPPFVRLTNGIRRTNHFVMEAWI